MGHPEGTERSSILGSATENPIESPLIEFDAAARYLGVVPETLRHWLWRATRGEGTAPRSYKIGRHRRFRVADLDRWIESQAEETQACLLEATCRNCSQPIRAADREENVLRNRWVHTDEERSRGCRAASFTGRDWNDDLAASWKATPSDSDRLRLRSH